jgi:hypothetical protein
MVISEDIDVSYFALSLGEQQVPFLEYGAAGRTQPGGLDQFRYPPVSVGPTLHPGYYKSCFFTYKNVVKADTKITTVTSWGLNI